MKGHPTTPPAYKTKLTSNERPNETKTVEKVGSVTTITQKIEFVTSPSELYQIFMDVNRVRAWSRSDVRLEPKVGGKFSLFGGNVEGEFLEIVEREKIKMTWRLKSWPAGHFSIVTMSFLENQDSTTIKLVQEKVPLGEKDRTEKNWYQYYWNSIKAVFG